MNGHPEIGRRGFLGAGAAALLAGGAFGKTGSSGRPDGGEVKF